MGLAIFFTAVSSSCSYAATAAGKTAFKKGAALPVAPAFMFASTNLVVELSAVLWVLMGSLFVLAEFVGAIVLVATTWGIVWLTLPKGLEDEARQHAGAGNEMMECCGNSEMSSGSKWTSVASSSQMDVGMMWKELLGGFLIAVFLMALVPDDWWPHLFVTDAPPRLRLVQNAIMGPLIAMAAFFCSIVNIPLESWLWSKGIGFGCVVSFVFAELIVVRSS